VEIALHEHLAPHQAALQVAEQRHETRHALATWRPPRDSYRAVDLPGEHHRALQLPPPASDPAALARATRRVEASRCRRDITIPRL
jgi:hypothetical protein